MVPMLSPTDLLLRCPVCADPLELRAAEPSAQRRLSCSAGHSFDAARQGYFNLLVGKGTAFESDSSDMVNARANFLAKGHYQPLADAVAAAVISCLPGKQGTVLDAGTGSGHYLRTLLDSATREGCRLTAVGLDISKFALRRAGRLNSEAINMVCDIWQPLPLADCSVDAITVIFAPRNAAEFARVLRRTGRLIVVTPRPGHLAALAEHTGMLGIEEGKDERLAEAMGRFFDVEQASDMSFPVALTRAEAADLAFMGPAGHHHDRRTIAAGLEHQPEPLRVEARFRLTVLQPKGAPAP